MSLKRQRSAFIDRRGDRLEVIGNLPQQLAVGGFLDIFIGKSGNFFIAIENDSNPIASRAVFEKSAYPVGAPQRNDIGLGDEQDCVGEITKQSRGLIYAP